MMIGGTLALASLAGALFVFTPYFLGAKTSPQELIAPPQTESLLLEKQVAIDLTNMTLTMTQADGTSETVPLVSKGKPGSYYETPGGRYINDYKTPLHFSSIGHVYMPYSIHIFGNFFIHGIPYYPDGEKVASTYSGGCIRLEDNDAKKVYDFIERGTPIIITGEVEEAQVPTLSVEDMERLMIATISLEFIHQDNQVVFEGATTTRRALLPLLLSGTNPYVAGFIAYPLGHGGFVDQMNEKAKAIGLRNTSFGGLTGTTKTTEDDLRRFASYIATYKSYLLTVK